MSLLIKSFVVGLITGGLFTLLRLPLPAPSALAGIVGIGGIYVGYVLIRYFIK